MISSGYIGKIKELLDMYRRREYQEAERGSCNSCLRREGEVLCFYFVSDLNERREFAHRECLDSLLDEENFLFFVIKTLRKIAIVNVKLQAINN